MKTKSWALFPIALLMSFGSLPLYAAKSEGPKLNVTHGPAKVSLEKVAQIDVPSGYDFMDGKSLRALLRAEGEPVGGNEYGSLSPTNESWAVMFRYDDVGFVKDDDKDKLDADKLLDSIRRGTEAANKQRSKNGLAALEVVGWEQPPHYDPDTHNLEWAVRGRSEGHEFLNYNTRLLGRKGVMEVLLIVDPEQLRETLPTFRNVLTGYSFQTGQTYAEYKPGDKIAKYGLAALVVGGAAVGAAKLGLFSSLFLVFKKAAKLVIVAVVAIAAAIKKFFAKIFGRKSETGTMT
jgi:uncharacterized membrane-anchored protein